MNKLLSTHPAWLKPTPQILALDGKSIVIADEGSRIPAHLRVADADPQSRDAGMCSVVAWQASMSPMDVEWANAGSPPPTSQAHQWERYLTEEALGLIQKNEEDSEYGDLVLDVPAQAA